MPKRVVLRGRSGTLRVIQGFLLTAAAGAIAGACAETNPIAVGEGGGGTTQIEPAICNGVEGSVQCGDGCCDPGFTCTQFGKCVSAEACTEETSCNSDSVCRRGTCVPWDILADGARFDPTCRTTFDLPSVIPTVQCRWPGESLPSEFPNSVQVIGTPMVIDFDFDQNPATIEPSIVFVSYEGQYSQSNGVVRVIDGSSCELQTTIAAPTTSLGFRPQVSPALGDVDGDARPDIVVADTQAQGAAQRSGVVVYKWSGAGTAFEELGRVTSASTAPIQGFSLHDLDGDELPEILTQNTVLQYDPAFMDLVEISNDIDSARALALEPPIVCDVEGNGTAELVTAAGVFYWDTDAEEVLPRTPEPGALPYFNPNSAVEAQFVALADLGNFPTVSIPGAQDSVEMVAVGFGGELWVKRVDGFNIMQVDADTGVGGPPVIADFDGDGKMEFASPGDTHITVFDLDCLRGDLANAADCESPDGPNARGIVWQKPIRGANSGAAVFDFDGNGKAEVVYADQCYMRVFDGATGSVLFSVPRSSTTQWEYPVVADTDGDGKSELVTTSNDNDDSITCPLTDALNPSANVEFVKTHGVTVWRDQEDRWAGSRPIWNQHGYFVTNVTDNGVIPSMFEVQSHWNARRNPQRPNTFRQNVQGATGQSLALPDITTAGHPDVQCLDNGVAVLKVDLCNRGIRELRANEAQVTLVETDNARNVLCNPTNARALPSQTCLELSCEVPSQGRAINVTVMADSASSVAECDERNNSSTISNVFCASDIQ